MSKISRAPYGLPSWYVPTLFGLVVEVFLLIALGGSVRLMNAGLACPDWPLCFGDFIPDYHPQVYLEFIHRAAAGLVALTTVGLTGVLLFRGHAPRAIKGVAIAAVLLLIAQIVFGGLTVLWALQANVVATHLSLGTAFFGLLLWQYLSLKWSPAVDVRPALARWHRGLLMATYGQLILGGLVASRYAALACTDWPLCQGRFVPTLSGPVGIHVLHRLGAYTLTSLVVMNWFLARRWSGDQRVRRMSNGMMALVVVQVGLGVANVLLRVPPIVGVAHLASATGLLAFALRQVQATRAGGAVVASPPRRALRTQASRLTHA